jgi:hypothetical protein
MPSLTLNPAPSAGALLSLALMFVVVGLVLAAVAVTRSA